MEHGANTTYVRYRLLRASRPLSLTLKALVNYRDYHSLTQAAGWHMYVEPVANGLRLSPQQGGASFYLLSPQAQATAVHDWYRNFYLSLEAERGLDALEDHLLVGLFQASLEPEASLSLVASTEPAASLDAEAALARHNARQEELLKQAGNPRQPAVAQLALAADQFIVRRAAGEISDGRSIIAGYPWFGDWGRDTMIALPGLTLPTGRAAEAKSILRTYAQCVDQGMLPNRFPDAGDEPEYNTADASLWFFEALRAVDAAGRDKKLLRELFPVLVEIIDAHRRGARYNIHVDPADGLLYAGEPGVQLTWMDAKVGDWVVTPRIGKPVELSALWHNALLVTAAFARALGRSDRAYRQAAEQTRLGFARFWNQEAGCCYDVLDGPDGDEAALRPNQLLAVSLPHGGPAHAEPLLPAERQQAVVELCQRRLLTPLGLRSLEPGHHAYRGRYAGDLRSRDGAYHQGTAWSWLIGPFAAAHLRVYGQPALTRAYLEPLLRHLADYGLGSIAEIFDGDAPFEPRGCFAQAWGVAELLRAWTAVS